MLAPAVDRLRKGMPWGGQAWSNPPPRRDSSSTHTGNDDDDHSANAKAAAAAAVAVHVAASARVAAVAVVDETAPMVSAKPEKW